MHVRLLAALLVLGPVPAEAAQPKACRPTLRDYRALKKGDSLKAVTARLGCHGRRVSSMKIGKRRTASYSWRGKGSFGASLVLTFRNGRLSDTSQLGLE